MANANIEAAIEQIRVVAAAIVDPWFVVDDEERIVAYNDAFYGVFPPPVARKIAGKTCRDVAEIPACATDTCLRRACVAEGPIRLDEVEVKIAGGSRQMILSAAPVSLGGTQQGALIVLRDVSDEARVQREYQRLKDEVTRLEKELEDRVAARTRDLMAANAELNRLEREIARLKRGGY